MHVTIKEAHIRQLLALNERMLQIGAVSQNEHDFIRCLQLKKLTNLQDYTTINK
jgi:hypothetical protein